MYIWTMPKLRDVEYAIQHNEFNIEIFLETCSGVTNIEIVIFKKHSI